MWLGRTHNTGTLSAQFNIHSLICMPLTFTYGPGPLMNPHRRWLMWRHSMAQVTSGWRSQRFTVPRKVQFGIIKYNWFVQGKAVSTNGTRGSNDIPQVFSARLLCNHYLRSIFPNEHISIQFYKFIVRWRMKELCQRIRTACSVLRRWIKSVH